MPVYISMLSVDSDVLMAVNSCPFVFLRYSKSIFNDYIS